MGTLSDFGGHLMRNFVVPDCLVFLDGLMLAGAQSVISSVEWSVTKAA